MQAIVDDGRKVTEMVINPAITKRVNSLEAVAHLITSIFYTSIEEGVVPAHLFSPNLMQIVNYN